MPSLGAPAARKDIYVGMLILTCLSMAVGIAVLAVEGMEYDWESQPKGGPAVTLPKVADIKAAPAK